MSSVANLRSCRFTDWAKVQQISLATLPEVTSADISYLIRTPEVRIRVACTETNEIAGFTILVPKPEINQAWLEQIAVAPPFRRQGLAALLLSDFEHLAASLGYPKAGLAVAQDNSAAIKLYAARGYSKISSNNAKFGYIKELPDVSSRREKVLFAFMKKTWRTLLYSTLVRTS